MALCFIRRVTARSTFSLPLTSLHMLIPKETTKSTALGPPCAAHRGRGRHITSLRRGKVTQKFPAATIGYLTHVDNSTSTVPHVDSECAGLLSARPTFSPCCNAMPHALRNAAGTTGISALRSPRLPRHAIVLKNRLPMDAWPCALSDPPTGQTFMQDSVARRSIS